MTEHLYVIALVALLIAGSVWALFDAEQERAEFEQECRQRDGFVVDGKRCMRADGRVAE